MSDEVTTSDLIAKYLPRELTVSSEGVRPLIPMTRKDVEDFAQDVIDAGMIPSSYEEKSGTTEERLKRTKAKLMIGIMKGLEVGFGPMTALSTIMIVNNRPSVYGDGAIALANRGRAVEWEKSWYEGEAGTDEWTAFYQVKRRGQDEPITRHFAVKDAKRAHLWMNANKAPWVQYPARMMFNRARAFALRDAFADLLMGLSIVEEVQDIHTEPKQIERAELDNLLGPVDTPHSDRGEAVESEPPAQEPT